MIKHIPVPVTVIMPAQNEAGTIGSIITEVRLSRFGKDILVIDCHSTDGTARVAAEAGARVISVPAHEAKGKGSAIKKALQSSTADILVFIDADLKLFKNELIDQLVHPILSDTYDYAILTAQRTGGRITELVVKPLLSIFFPEITLMQPLSGEYAIKKSVLQKFALVETWGIEIALIIDAVMNDIRVREVFTEWTRQHDEKPLVELKKESLEIIQTLLAKAYQYNRCSSVKGIRA